jgi:malonyl-CoA O-methyltransferase
MDRYAAWAPTYPPYAHNTLMEVEQTAMLELLPPVVGRRVLDCGCGSGRYVQLLTALGAQVIGVDLSAAMATRAHLLSSLVARGDMRALPIATGACDIVVSGLAVIDVADLQAVTAEWARVLCRRGVVVYSTLHPTGRELGWSRTFEANGQVCSLPAHWHSEAEHRRACRNVGLEIEAVEQPASEQGGPPVALIIRARKQ